MKNFNIFYIFVFGVCFLIRVIDWNDAKAIQGTEDGKFRSPGDILNLVNDTALKSVVPLMAEIPLQIGEMEKPLVDKLFPIVKKYADEVSILPPLPFSNMMPVQMQEKMATMQIEPIFMALNSNPLTKKPLLFFRPLSEPIVGPLKPLLDELFQLLISLAFKTLMHGGNMNQESFDLPH